MVGRPHQLSTSTPIWGGSFGAETDIWAALRFVVSLERAVQACLMGHKGHTWAWFSLFRDLQGCSKEFKGEVWPLVCILACTTALLGREGPKFVDLTGDFLAKLLLQPAEPINW